MMVAKNAPTAYRSPEAHSATQSATMPEESTSSPGMAGTILITGAAANTVIGNHIGTNGFGHCCWKMMASSSPAVRPATASAPPTWDAGNIISGTGVTAYS